MDYEKKYKEIVGQIKKAYLYAQTDSAKAVLEEILPELKESEDEKVRKEIVRFIQMEVEDEIVGNKWLAWLGKQCEQKSAEWSEDDNEHAESILERLEGMCKKGATFTTTRFAVNQDIDWLKSLKQRIGE